MKIFDPVRLETVIDSCFSLRVILHSVNSTILVYKNCADIYKLGDGKRSGVYKIYPDSLGPFHVFCDQNTDGSGWTLFQKRHDGSVGFYRGWDSYERGFGYLNTECWLGLDKIHRLTSNGK